ncbi:MAG: tRNA (adenosine(37)-N6)-threonylcarbamoyltransferase complex transferase subunit TsaD [Pseudomonadota bacterium]
MTPSLTVLGIESSCDDTAAAVVRRKGGCREILSSVVIGQNPLHAPFGGVVPEIAARAHVEKLDLAVEEALRQTGLTLRDIDAIAVTSGPGLIGGVVAGVMLARGLAAGSGLPLIGVNHLAGHALTPRLTDGMAFPYLMLLVSGGHCQFLLVEGVDRFQRLGGTIDDAPGEAFDKTAKVLGLSQPGGPAVEAEAAGGDRKAFALPRPLLNRPGCDMSFSGLKTAVLRARDEAVTIYGGLPARMRRDLCASFQQAVAEVFAEKTRRALIEATRRLGGISGLAVAGGVAANAGIRTALARLARETDTVFVAPPLKLCTDNGAMIAWAGIERLIEGRMTPDDLRPRPRWPLDRDQSPLLGSGKKGAKA